MPFFSIISAMLLLFSSFSCITSVLGEILSHDGNRALGFIRVWFVRTCFRKLLTGRRHNYSKSAQVHYWGIWCHCKELLTFVSRSGELAACALPWPQSEALMGIFSISHASRSKACSHRIYNLTCPLYTSLPCGQQISKLYWSLWPF